MNSQLKEKVQNLPQKPGVYQYFDAEGTIIYVGKAKRLKNRVSSYFNKDKHQSGKKALLVRKIVDLKFILVNTEYEALLLENSLIKKYKPRYNIQWRDDKSYPYICIKKERFPRIFATRQMVKDGSLYFGPYASAKMMHAMLDLIRKLHKFRTCSLNLSDENIQAKKFKVCLEYQIGNCLGPCEGLQSIADYDQSVENVKKLLKGSVSDLISEYKTEMKTAAETMLFERANEMKERVEMLEHFRERSVVVHPNIDDVDVFALEQDDKFAYAAFLKIVKGAIIQSHTLEMRKNATENAQELLISAVIELRNRFKSTAKEIFLPFETGVELPEVKSFVPQRGDKRKLLFLAKKNAMQFMKDRHRKQEQVDPDRRSNRILTGLQKDLNMKELPYHIECFDNSNFQGSNPVAACVVFKNAKASKKDYRHFNIKTVVGPDDFASMTEVVFRRYKRLLAEKQDLPQLIVIDGGKGQLSAAYESLVELGLEKKISIIGIAKKLEEIFIPFESIPLYIDKKSESLKLIQMLRNEAHRFGITHHRNQRSKSSLKSGLTEIKGIGESTSTELLRKFKSLKRVKEASIEELTELIGPSKAKIVHKSLHTK
ncbi:MAG TPA: excinuclease ABC subunit C [Flavobacteriales bacterium]|nr:excinuclease ABC subunit C [Flavobacteriales bacterium]